MTPGRREALVLGAIGLAAAAGGAVLGAFFLQSGSGASDLLAARFPDLEGKPRSLLEWKGRLVVCNFWATWCAPCREEVPVLVAAREKYAARGVEVVGIGLDQASNLREFAAAFQISYPVLVADASAVDLMRQLGNRGGGLPYTVVLDRSGAIAHRHLGAVTQAQLEQVLAGLLR